MAAGGVGGMSFWLVTFPADVIKSRIQVSNLTGSLYTVGLDIFRKEGTQTFFINFNALKLWIMNIVDQSNPRNLHIIICHSLNLLLSGVGALYNGLRPTLLRTFPATATLFLTYEYSKKIMHELFNDDSSDLVDSA